MKKFSKILFILGAMTILPTPSLGASVQLAVCEAVWVVADQIYNATDHFEDWVGQMEQTCGNLPSQYVTFCESCINEIFYQALEDGMSANEDTCAAIYMPGGGGTLNCTPGEYKNDNKCKICPNGSYNPTANNTYCTNCPQPGTTSGTSASDFDSVTDCYVLSGTDSYGTYEYTQKCYYK